MKFFNLYVSQEKDAIKFRFDTIEYQEAYHYYFHDDTVRGMLLSHFQYPNNSAVEDSLNRRVEKQGDFTTKYKGENIKASFGISTYQLPVDPVTALDFLLAVARHITYRNFDYISTHAFPVTKLFSAADVHPRVLPGSLEQFLSTGLTSTDWTDVQLPETTLDVLKYAAERVIALTKDMPNYAAVNAALNKILQCQTPSLKECLSLPYRYAILTNVSFPADNSAESMDKFVRTIGNKLASENRMQEMQHLITNHQRSIKIAMYEPAIGKVAQDGGKFNWNYTEWYLLRDAVFAVRNDGNVSFKMAGNATYTRYYAPGCQNHNILEKEMRHLGKVIGVEFADNINFHDEIVFDKATSQRLIASGILLDSACLRDMLQPKNIGLLFKHDTAATTTPEVAPVVESQNKL